MLYDIDPYSRGDIQRYWFNTNLITFEDFIRVEDEALFYVSKKEYVLFKIFRLNKAFLIETPFNILIGLN